MHPCLAISKMLEPSGVYILPLNFKIAPKVRGARAENFYICPSSHNAIFKNLPILCYFLANFWKNWQILIKLYLKYQNYWKKLGILDKFLKKLVNLCNFFLFLPFYCSKYFISAPPHSIRADRHFIHHWSKSSIYGQNWPIILLVCTYHISIIM